MDKVSVNPGKVRCLGNIVSPKTASDFGTLNGTIASSTDTVNSQSMTVYSTDYLVGSSITLSYTKLIGEDTASFTVSATLKNNSNSAINGATVYFDCNGTVTNATTNSSGVASFTVTTDGSNEYRFRAYYTGTGSLAGSSAYGQVFALEVTHVTLYSTGQVLQGCLFVSEATDENIPVPGAKVSVCEYNPDLFKYTGTGGTEPDSFSYNNRVTVTADSTGTTLTGNSSSIYYCWASLGEDTSGFYDFFGDITIEFDVVSLSNQGALLQIYADGSTNYFQKTLRDDFGCTGGEHVKITVTDYIVECYVDDVKIDSLTTELDFNRKYRVGFRGYNGWVLKFKNFKIGGY